MPFGPLVTLIFLVYVLFLGIVMTLWFLLSPRRSPDAGQRQREASGPAASETPSEPYKAPRRGRRRTSARKERAPRAYAGVSNDETRGANVKVVDADSGPPARSPAEPPASDPSPAPVKRKRKSDAFEDFIRSKNDDFEF